MPGSPTIKERHLIALRERAIERRRKQDDLMRKWAGPGWKPEQAIGWHDVRSGISFTGKPPRTRLGQWLKVQQVHFRHFMLRLSRWVVRAVDGILPRQ